MDVAVGSTPISRLASRNSSRSARRRRLTQALRPVITAPRAIISARPPQGLNTASISILLTGDARTSRGDLEAAGLVEAREAARRREARGIRWPIRPGSFRDADSVAGPRYAAPAS